ncbi:MAG: hypothetical protein KL863_05175 [Rhizobium sp.]|nr:hypothetical protein [Rhizobium sp.]
MMRFLAAVAAVLAKMFSTGWSLVTSPLCWLDGLFGGGSKTVMPDRDIPLPSEDEIEVAKYSAKSEAIGKNAVLSLNPALQAFRYATSDEYDRYDADLTLLKPDQKAWLRSLSEDDLKTVAAADLQQIDRALRGELYAVKGVDTVSDDTRPTDIAFAERLWVARSVADERHNVCAV